MAGRIKEKIMDDNHDESRTVTVRLYPRWVKRQMKKIVCRMGQSLVTGAIIIIEIPDVLDEIINE
jgi:hypothetical protein